MIDGMLTDPADPFSMIVRKATPEQFEATNPFVVADMAAHLRSVGFSGGIVEARKLLAERYDPRDVNLLAMSAVIEALKPARLSA